MLAFPSSDVEFQPNRNAPSRDGEEHGHTRVNSSPTRPRVAAQWSSSEKGTPSRPRPHLRSLDLASASPPTTPSYLSPTFAFAPKSAGISCTAHSHATLHNHARSDSISLAALNLNPSSADELTEASDSSTDQEYIDLNDSPTLKLKPLAKAHLPASYSLVDKEPPSSRYITTKVSSLSASPHRREFFPRSPVRLHSQGLATPPLTPSSSFASGDTARSDHDEQDSDIEERSPIAHYEVHRSGKSGRVLQPAEIEHPDGARVVSLDEESHLRYITDTHDMLSKGLDTSPIRPTTYNPPDPDSPTPVRGRKLELCSDGMQNCTPCASSVRDRQASKPPVSGVKLGFNKASGALTHPSSLNDECGPSADTRRSHARAHTLASTDPFAYMSHPVPPPHAHQEPPANVYAYGYPVYDIPPPFDPSYGLVPMSHIQRGPPPPVMGHHAFDSALAQAYASRFDSHGSPTYEANTTQTNLPNHASLDLVTEQHAPPSQRHFSRPSKLYTNRHSRKNSSHEHTKRNYAGRSDGRSSPFPTLNTSLHAPSMTPPPSVPDKNILDIEAIASGVDTRTTVMIKNIPNKMTDTDLLDFINRVSPRRIDFFYLRMDFTNGCNVGYAFVNFILPEDLLHFAQTQLGVKWNMYSSEKVLQLSYANYQGKEALVEKFRNSGIMDERPAWRPRIFHSAGPEQGNPQPFPQPTHLRRKERSANNRGALFVPAPSMSGPRQHHVYGPPQPAYWAPGGFGHVGWAPQ